MKINRIHYNYYLWIIFLVFGLYFKIEKKTNENIK